MPRLARVRRKDWGLPRPQKAPTRANGGTMVGRSRPVCVFDPSDGPRGGPEDGDVGVPATDSVFDGWGEIADIGTGDEHYTGAFEGRQGFAQTAHRESLTAAEGIEASIRTISTRVESPVLEAVVEHQDVDRKMLSEEHSGEVTVGPMPTGARPAYRNLGLVTRLWHRNVRAGGTSRSVRGMRPSRGSVCRGYVRRPSPFGELEDTGVLPVPPMVRLPTLTTGAPIRGRRARSARVCGGRRFPQPREQPAGQTMTAESSARRFVEPADFGDGCSVAPAWVGRTARARRPIAAAVSVPAGELHGGARSARRDLDQGISGTEFFGDGAEVLHVGARDDRAREEGGLQSIVAAASGECSSVTTPRGRTGRPVRRWSRAAGRRAKPVRCRDTGRREMERRRRRVLCDEIKRSGLRGARS